MNEKKLSHKEAIKQLLLLKQNEWVDLPYLSNFTAYKCHSQCYVVHSRIAQLRKAGLKIENKVERTADHVAVSKYKLVMQ